LECGGLPPLSHSHLAPNPKSGTELPALHGVSREEHAAASTAFQPRPSKLAVKPVFLV